MKKQNHVGEKIAQRRKALGLRMKDIAGEDFTVSFVSQIEGGKVNPSVPSLEKIARKLAVPMSYFFGSENTAVKIPSLAARNLLSDFFALDNLLRAHDYERIGKLLRDIRSKLDEFSLSELTCLCDYYEGVVLFNSGDKLAAANIVSKVLPHLEDNAFPDKLANCHNILARAYHQQGNYNAAVLGCKACISLIRENNLAMNDIQTGALLLLGELYLVTDELFEAYDAYNQALNAAPLRRYPAYAMRAHEGLAQCYARSNYPDKSARHETAAKNIAQILDQPDD